MLLRLPFLGAYLLPCPVPSAEMMPHPDGHYCHHCARSVPDFEQATDPVAALAAARAAAPDGRVCGSFRVVQVAKPQLKPWLRRFLVALVLVVGRGLPAREALAQVRGARPVAGHPRSVAGQERSEVLMGGVVEKMPEYKHGGMVGIQRFIVENLRYPVGATQVGKLFISFTIDEKGKLQNPKVIKGLEPVLDAEALRVIKLLKSFAHSRQSGRPVAVAFTLPITFQLK